MDQDFHYYGTYYAARAAGWNDGDATKIAKASNFIDFLSESSYAGYWRLVRDTQKPSDVEKCKVVGVLNSPRYTFQGGLFGSAASPEDGLWGSYHFTPGNYKAPSGTSSILAVHGLDVKQQLPEHEVRNVVSYKTYEKTLNRPLSALSRAMIEDAVACSEEKRLKQILERSLGGWELLNNKDVNCVNLFKLMLLGVRSHVVADTWAHQDHAPYADDINTYWDINDGWGRQGIEYQDSNNTWTYVVLTSADKFVGNSNFEAAPNKGGKLGHGWMGHFPDYSFVKYRYKAAWRGSKAAALVRDNPTQYKYAWLELCSMLNQANGNGYFFPSQKESIVAKAVNAISAACDLSDKKNIPRGYSAARWKEQFRSTFGVPADQIDAVKEPDPLAVLPGELARPGSYSSRYNFFTITCASELYLFQIAADYHFQFVKQWLAKHGIMQFTGSWSKQLGAVSPLVSDLW